MHVAFKGGAEAMIEAMTGPNPLFHGTLVVRSPFIKDGKLLAWRCIRPSAHPYCRCAGPGEICPTSSDLSIERIAGACRDAPPILNQISKEVARILDLPDIKEWLRGMGIVSAPTTPEEHDKILRAQIETLSKVVRDAGLRPR